MALTDNQQSILVLISAALIAVGGTTIPAGVPWQIGLALSIIGAVGFAVKEALGTKVAKADGGAGKP